MSWNLNGIRSAERKGFLTWLGAEQPDILGVQETRIDDAALPDELRRPLGYASQWVFPERKGYSGVALFYKPTLEVLAVHDKLGVPEYDVEGRLVGIELADFSVYSVYFPKGSGNLRDNSRVPYKLGFYDAAFAAIAKWSKKSKKPSIVMGDFNTAHANIDLRNWKSNQQTSGFLPEEREHLSKHLAKGYVDTFRALHPTAEQYSWWSQRFNVREKNIGWRIDYVWASEALMPRVEQAFIRTEVRGSDHAPVGVMLRPA